MRRQVLAFAAASALVSCVGTTGGELVTFNAFAAGPADAEAGKAFEFVSDFDWNVVLTTAKLHVGALYLNRTMPISGVQNTSCILPSTYVAEVTAGLDVDLLSPELQPFPQPGVGATEPPAIVGQVWLSGTRVDHQEDMTPILRVEGTANREGVSRPFSGTVTIGTNRLLTTADSTQAGAAPICKQRIVSPIPISVSLQKTGYLLLRIDPRLLFVNVDFSALPAFGDGFGFTDDVTRKDQPSVNLYNNLRAAGRLYTLEWVP